MTKGNTAITDRPSKISDKYGDLFDNEWIDALEFMDEKKRYHSPDMDTTEVEEIAIRHLCRLLMVIEVLLYNFNILLVFWCYTYLANEV